MSIDDLESAYGYGGSREKVMEAIRSLDPGETGPHGRTAMHVAAENVDPEAMEALISNGFRAGIADEYGRTPLHILAVQRWEGRTSKMAECTDILLANRCPPNRRDDSGRCFYHIAADMHNLPMISLIGQRLIRCDSALESSGMNALHLLCESGNRYDRLRESDPEGFGAKDEMCRRMAEWLIGGGIDPEAETRIGRKAVAFARENGLGKTASLLRGDAEGFVRGMDLYQATITDDAPAVSELLSKGTNPDEFWDRDGDYKGMTSLMIACRRMCAPVAEALLNGGASATLSDGRDGHTAMYHLLVSLRSTVGTGSNDRGSGTLAKNMGLLVDSQGSPDLDVGTDEGPPLCFVCATEFLGWTSDGRSARQAAFDWLISHGADPDARDGSGRTPLICACMSGGKEAENIVCTLMELGADPDARDACGRTAIMHASAMPGDSGLDLIKTILDFYEPCLDFRDSDGKDALEIAADSGNTGVLKYLLERRRGL